MFQALIDGVSKTHTVRVVTIDGAPWFVGVDVCTTLGIDATGVAYKRLPADEKTKVCRAHLGHAPGKPMVLLSESGLYKLIMRSDKPAATPFQEWVTREVLPSIRKTGGYMLPEDEPMPLPPDFASALRQHAATLIKLAEEQEAHARTKAEAEAAERQAERLIELEQKSAVRRPFQ